MAAKVGTVVIDIGADTAKLVSGMNKAERAVKRSVGNMKTTVLSLASAYLGIEGAMKALNIAADFTKTAAKFEQFESVLETIEGSSEKAGESMDWITEFAKTTPYELGSVAESFVKLRAYGINPTDGTLKALGDTASAMGKPLSQAVEAMADAVVGENERLKEFGIRASKEGDKIAYSWTNSSGEMKRTVIDNNSDIIESTLEAILNSKYEGAMEKQSKTFDGLMSNMSNQWTIFQKKVMDAGLLNYIKAVISAIVQTLPDAFGAAGQNSGEFAKYVIDKLNGVIDSVGFLYDAFTGVRLVIKSIEIGFLYLVKGITYVIDGAITGINFLIKQYNSLPESMRGEKAGLLSKLGTDAVNEEIAEAKKEWSGLVDSLSDGRSFAKGFIEDVSVSFTKFQLGSDDAIKKTTEFNAAIENIENGAVAADEKLANLKSAINSVMLTDVEKIGYKWMSLLDGIPETHALYSQAIDAMNAEIDESLSSSLSGYKSGVEELGEAISETMETAADKINNRWDELIKNATGASKELLDAAEKARQKELEGRGKENIGGNENPDNAFSYSYGTTFWAQPIMSLFDWVKSGRSASDYTKSQNALMPSMSDRWQKEWLTNISSGSVTVREFGLEMEVVTESIAVFDDAIRSFERGMSSLEDVMSTALGMIDDNMEASTDHAKQMFYQSLQTARDYESQVIGDPTNIDLIKQYEEAVNTFSEYSSNYLGNTDYFASYEDYLMAKAVSSSAASDFYQSASTTDQLLMDLKNLTELTNLALDDGNVTAEEAKAINSAAKEILDSGTISTTDSDAYDWLKLIENATSDGVVTTDELKSITQGAVDAIDDQDSDLFTIAAKTEGIEENTQSIGKYKVTATKIEAVTVTDPTTGWNYTEVMPTETLYTPYKMGGYTGDFGVNQVAGVVHGQEYVVNAKTTRDLGLNHNNGGVFKEILAENIKYNQRVGNLEQMVYAQTKEVMKLREVIDNVTEGGKAMRTAS
jgi:hypothetical protein